MGPFSPFGVKKWLDPTAFLETKSGKFARMGITIQKKDVVSFKRKKRIGRKAARTGNVKTRPTSVTKTCSCKNTNTVDLLIPG